ncbi:hypothetical protein DdX_06592 [Ditylenchus destructor]|uniref:Uncharacterized protein n=1 Tax=Ditylenchus destructor TaxID=166010 RepID=A0AAD4R936_9BILA|nr:hypothetical protein DdX_06592 [Ditylenchus destructor]
MDPQSVDYLDPTLLASVKITEQQHFQNKPPEMFRRGRTPNRRDKTPNPSEGNIGAVYMPMPPMNSKAGRELRKAGANRAYSKEREVRAPVIVPRAPEPMGRGVRNRTPLNRYSPMRGEERTFNIRELNPRKPSPLRQIPGQTVAYSRPLKRESASPGPAKRQRVVESDSDMDDVTSSAAVNSPTKRRGRPPGSKNRSTSKKPVPKPRGRSVQKSQEPELHARLRRSMSRDSNISHVSNIRPRRRTVSRGTSSNGPTIQDYEDLGHEIVDHWKKIERMKRMIEDIKKAYDAKAKTFLEAIL